MIPASQYLIYAIVVINAVAAVRRWRRDRTYPSVLMAVGNVGAVIGFVLVQFFSYSLAGNARETGALSFVPSVWHVPGRVLLISGFVFF
jgi:hypothetical protein